MVSRVRKWVWRFVRIHEVMAYVARIHSAVLTLQARVDELEAKARREGMH